MVKVLPKLTFLLVFCFMILGISAQGTTVNLTTFEDTPITYTFKSRNTPFISQLPQHGELTVSRGELAYQYVVTYAPDPGYIGEVDQARVLSFPLEQSSFTITVFNFRVVKVELEARHDLARTVANTPVRIPVLENDYSSVGEFELRSVPVVNGGTATIDGDFIVFTPASNFSGLTDFNYLICAGDDVCDLGTVSVNVLKEDFSVDADTVQVFTKRGKPQFVLAPESYEPLGLPENGVYGEQDGVRIYTPEDGFVGTEYLEFTGPNGSTVTYAVEVLDMSDEEFLTDDVAYTLVGHPVTVNVLENDYYGSFTGCVEIGQPQFGTINAGASPGRFNYRPPANWTGVDRVTYTGQQAGCTSETETATVYIIVSDFTPEGELVEITTTAGDPTPLTYSTPTGEVEWTLASPPSAGTVITDEDGQLVYVGSEAGTDQLSITYCLKDDNDCRATKTVAVNITVNPAGSDAGCTEDCVWPGDTNNDGAVDMADFLAIGLYTGKNGTPRLSAAPATWCPQDAEAWEEETPDGLNLKYVDANGDQVISSLDTQVVMENYGLAHRLRPTALGTSSFDIILEGDIFAEPGDLLKIDVLVGTRLIGVEDAYGFIFPFPYDPTIFNPATVEVEFDEGSWMSYESPVISAQVNNQEQGLLTAAYVRTNGKTTSGYGRVGRLLIGVEDAYGFGVEYDDTTLSTTIGGDDGEALNGQGVRNRVKVRPLDITIVDRPEISQPLDGDIDQYLDDKLLAFPNPATNQLTVHMNGRRSFSALQLTDITGRRVIQQNDILTNHLTLNLSQVPTGIYTLSVTTEEGVVNRKIEVIH